MSPTEADRALLGLEALPPAAEALCLRYGAAPRLVAHLTLVHDVALRLVEQVGDRWRPGFDAGLVLFGAATHDLGKAVHVAELSGAGAEHETTGLELLLRAGVPEREARFAVTHAAWESEDVTLEDLLVTLADKVWKGKRIEDLELAVARAIATSSGVEFWTVYQDLAEILDELSSGAEERLEWQARFGVAQE